MVHQTTLPFTKVSQDLTHHTIPPWICQHGFVLKSGGTLTSRVWNVLHQVWYLPNVWTKPQPILGDPSDSPMTLPCLLALVSIEVSGFVNNPSYKWILSESTLHNRYITHTYPINKTRLITHYGMSSGPGQAPCRLQQNQVHRHGWSRAALRRAQKNERKTKQGHHGTPITANDLMTKENGDLMASSLSNMLMFTQMSPIPHQTREWKKNNPRKVNLRPV
jgi:hypothetical protein